MITNKERFKANIRLFEIEPHSYCNRKCWFCPNKFIDRTGPTKHFDWGIYQQILKDLASIDYSESMAFAGWCEPFSRPENLISMVSEARRMLPNVSMFSNTNTDFLTTELVHKISKAGLNQLKCQLYLGEHEEYKDEIIRGYMCQLQNKLPGIKFKEKAYQKWFALVGDLLVVAYAKNFHKEGHNRCDVQIRPVLKRYHTCGETITMFGVNYNGWAVPCCNIRSDYKPHRNVLLGKMDDSPGRLFELYKGAIIPENQYPCAICMGKQWHPNHKIVHNGILKELKDGELNRCRVSDGCEAAVGSAK